jgi:hypothetical protein
MAGSALRVPPSRAGTAPPGLRARFTSPAEFVAELRRLPPDLEPVVRLTYRWTADPEGLPIRHLSVVAGYVRHTGRGSFVLEELVHYAGQVWPGLDHEGSERTKERARRAHEAVEQAARELGLDVCAGVYELGNGAGGTRS